MLVPIDDSGLDNLSGRAEHDSKLVLLGVGGEAGYVHTAFVTLAVGEELPIVAGADGRTVVLAVPCSHVPDGVAAEGLWDGGGGQQVNANQDSEPDEWRTASSEADACNKKKKKKKKSRGSSQGAKKQEGSNV